MIHATIYMPLGYSECCQHLRVASDGIANDTHWRLMGYYDYIATDPDGGRIYHNPKSNSFISRMYYNDWMNKWFVSLKRIIIV